MTRDLSKLFNPDSIAVIGASADPNKVGSIALRNIIISGFKGKIFPVNPHVKNIGQMQFSPDVTQLPTTPDLAVIAIPANLVIAEIKQCAESGIKNFIVFSSGFKEIGSAGQALEDELVKLALKFNLNILGPNCLGFASPSTSLNITFGQVIKQSGAVRLISQSGALVTSYFDLCQSNQVGFDWCVTLGNKTNVNENDILNHWSNTPSPVGLYLESINVGQEFIKQVSRLTPTYPVFILKPGKSVAATSAIKSHTGSIATPDSILDVALQQSGVIRCRELEDFFDLALVISTLHPPSGPNVAVVSNAGGPAVLATDTIVSSGLQLATFSSQTTSRLSKVLPSNASFHNPVDLLGDALAKRFYDTLKIIIDDPGVDSLLVIITPQQMTEISKTIEVINQIQKLTPKPILCSFVGDQSKVSHILNFSSPHRAINVLSSLWWWQKWRQQPVSAPTPVAIPHSEVSQLLNQSPLNELPEKLLSSLSILTPPTSFISSLAQADAFSQSNGYPVVLKVSSSQILHKTEVGGVITGIYNLDQLSAAYDKLSTVSSSLQIQKQIESGTEIIIGLKRDPTFGPVLMFGAGGKLAEIISDRNLAILPASQTIIKNIVSQSKVYPIISGFRGDQPYNLDQLFETINILAQLFIDYPQIAEIEINPLILTHHGLWAVDPKVILTSA